MTERDIILSAFACGGVMDCEKAAQAFEEPPLVLHIPGGSTTAFKKLAFGYKNNQGILDNYFRRNLPKGVTPKRVALVSFSAGWQWSTCILDQERDRNRIDSVLLMDGLHTSLLDGWKAYAALCARGGPNNPKLFMAHTQIKPTFISAEETNTRIMNSLSAEMDVPTREIPEYIWNVKLEEPIKVYSKIMPEGRKWKTFDEDPLVSMGSIGNAFKFEYSGGTPQDHIYNAQYVQPRFWSWLKEIWKDEKGVLWK